MLFMSWVFQNYEHQPTITTYEVNCVAYHED
uniref:Uncharacterized protein n=1 Tax=Lepeophtheirus salmonis TaxID=72036 RepID=A0A0K2U9J0_LEPSM